MEPEVNKEQEEWEKKLDELVDAYGWLGELYDEGRQEFIKAYIKEEKQKSLEEGQAHKGKAKREAYMEGYREGIARVQEVFKKSFVTTDVELVDRFLNKLIDLKRLAGDGEGE